jgi:two-component system OmpR family response regulator
MHLGTGDIGDPYNAGEFRFTLEIFSSNWLGGADLGLQCIICCFNHFGRRIFGNSALARILVVEDDQATAVMIEKHLRGNGHDVVCVADGAIALERARHEHFDAITLDRMLPGMDGLALVGRLRESFISVPILMISALSDVDERIAGLRAGGDDYMVKPFSAQEMAVRMESLLRRSANTLTNAIIRSGEIELNLLKRSAMFSGRPLRLPHIEFRLLEFLMRHAGKVVSRRLIFEQVWGYHFDPGANLINVHIGRLRKKLDQPGRPPIISTVKGEGYRFEVF